ncbi:MAG: glycosyltransferase family 2 protein [Acutalibacteraceae bacterium]
MPEISIIVPVYKVEQYLNSCIDSILAQSFTDFELILVDDGSPDNCGKICDEYAEKDSRVKVIHKENAGVSAARNSGIDLSSGKYIMFCDSDDYVDSNWCRSLYDAIENNDVELSVCGFRRFSCENKSITSPEFKTEHILNEDDLSNFWWMGSCWNKIYKASIIKTNKLYFDVSISYAEDLIFNLDYILNCTNFEAFFITGKYYNYRVFISNSLTHKYIPNLWELEKRVIDKIMTVCCSITDDDSFYLQYIYTDAIDRIFVCLDNIFYRKNTLNFHAKYLLCKQIIRSSYCKKAFKYGNFYKFGNGFKYLHLVVPVLKTCCPFIISVFYLLMGKFINHR